MATLKKIGKQVLSCIPSPEKNGTQIPQNQLKMFLVLPLVINTMFSGFLFAKLFFFFLMSVGCFFFSDFKFIYFGIL